MRQGRWRRCPSAGVLGEGRADACTQVAFNKQQGAAPCSKMKPSVHALLLTPPPSSPGCPQPAQTGKRACGRGPPTRYSASPAALPGRHSQSGCRWTAARGTAACPPRCGWCTCSRPGSKKECSILFDYRMPEAELNCPHLLSHSWKISKCSCPICGAAFAKQRSLGHDIRAVHEIGDGAEPLCLALHRQRQGLHSTGGRAALTNKEHTEVCPAIQPYFRTGGNTSSLVQIEMHIASKRICNSSVPCHVFNPDNYSLLLLASPPGCSSCRRSCTAPPGRCSARGAHRCGSPAQTRLQACTAPAAVRRKSEIQAAHHCLHFK